MRPQEGKKEGDTKYKYVINELDRQKLINKGHPADYVDGLGDNIKINHHFKQGQELSSKNLFEKAVKEFQQCLSHPLATDSNKVSPKIQIGNCYYRISRLEEAQKHYEEALKLTEAVENSDEQLKGRAAALGNIGLIYSDQGKPDEALSHQHNGSRKISRSALIAVS